MSDQLRDIRDPGWYWCANELIERDGKELGVYGIAVYNVLACMAGQKNKAFPSVATIADRIGCSSKQVRRVLKKLEELGWIQIEHRKEGGAHQSNVYHLLGGTDSQSPPLRTHSPQGTDSQSVKQDVVNKTQENNTTDGSADAERRPDAADRDYFFEGMCHVLGWDWSVITDKQRGQLNQTIGILKKAGYTVDHLRRFYEWWFENHWKGRKGEHPDNPAEVRKHIAKVNQSDKPRFGKDEQPPGDEVDVTKLKMRPMTDHFELLEPVQ